MARTKMTAQGSGHTVRGESAFPENRSMLFCRLSAST